MPSITEFPWNRVSPETQQRLGERLRAATLFLHARIPLLHALGIGLCFFFSFLYPLVVHLSLSRPSPSQGLRA